MKNFPDYENLLTTLQAGILKPDGRSHREYIFIKFEPGIDESTNKNRRIFLANLIGGKVTSCSSQLKDTYDFKKRCRVHREIRIINIAFSANGYMKINREKDLYQYPSDLSYRNGMALSRNRLGDYSSWQFEPWSDSHDCLFNNKVDPFYYYNPISRKDAELIDVVVIIGHSKKRQCNLEKEKLTKILEENRKSKCNKIINSFWVESGFQKYERDGGLGKYRSGRKYPVSPLGFRDGLSNPTSLRYIFDKILVQEDWTEEKQYGTYLAFRKIEVNEGRFDELITEAICEIKKFRRKNKKKDICDKKIRAFAEALYMGRFKNGTPLALSSEPLNEGHWRLDGKDFPFDYNDDVTGLKCPIGAHARRMNPHGTELNPVGILRRGMLYEEDRASRLGEFFDKSPNEKKCWKSGLLFVSFQRKITNGFEVLFDNMKVPDNVDSVVYHPGPREINYLTRFRVPPKPGTNAHIELKSGGTGLTTFRGGEYFFMPSITFINSLNEN